MDLCYPNLYKCFGFLKTAVLISLYRAWNYCWLLFVWYNLNKMSSTVRQKMCICYIYRCIRVQMEVRDHWECLCLAVLHSDANSIVDRFTPNDVSWLPFCFLLIISWDKKKIIIFRYKNLHVYYFKELWNFSFVW